MRGGCCKKGVAVRAGRDHFGMANNFIECDREQAFLMPPSLRDWLPEDHLAWFILASAEELDLSRFYAAYRDDGHGRPAHDPQMMVALLLYAYAKGEHSSRAIERECTEDILPGDLRQPGPRPHHDRPLPPAPRGGAGGALQRRARAPRRGGIGQDRGGRDRRNQDSRQRLPPLKPRNEQIARDVLAEAAEADRREEELATERRANAALAQFDHLTF
jgi:Transposase domain (DUF772)